MQVFTSLDDAGARGSPAPTKIGHRPGLLRAAQDSLLLYCVVSVLLAAIWALILGFSAVQKQGLLEESENELLQLRSAVARHTQGLVQSVESDLRVIDQWLLANPQIDPLTDIPFNALIEELRRASGGLIDPHIVSSTGTLHSLPGKAGQPLDDVGKRRYFTEPMRDAQRRVHIGDPLQSPVSGKWAIPMSWRLERQVGGMAVVVANIELDRLTAFHEQFRVRPAGTVLLLRGDGVVLSRTPFDSTLIGKNIGDRPGTRRVTEHRSGSYVSDRGLTDQVARLISFEVIDPYPIWVVVSRGQEDALQTYYARRNMATAVTAGLTILALVVTLRLARSQRVLRHERTQHARLAAELAAAQDASPLGFVRYGLDGKLTYVNDAWRRIYGLPAPADPNAWISQVSPEKREEAAATWYAAAAGTKSIEGLTRVHRRDGRAVLVSYKSAPVAVDGRTVGWVCSVEDITERAANERAKGMLTAVFDATSDFVSQVSPSGQLLYLNPAARRLAGLSLDAPLDGAKRTKFTPDWVREKRESEILPAVLAHGSWVGETAVLDAQGNEIPVSHMQIAHRSRDGAVQYFTSIRRDISQIKQAERAQLALVNQLHAILENASVGIMITRAGKFELVGRHLCQMFGYAEAELLGQRTYIIYQSEQAYVELGPRMRADFDVRGHFDGELVMRRRNGEEFWVHALGRGVIPGNATGGTIWILNDISKAREARDKLSWSATHDSLTALVNRNEFESRLEQAMAQFNGQEVCAMFIDLDQFKAVNDTAGHAAGDEVLRSVAALFEANVRHSDTVARLGGDEFAVLLPGCPLSRAQELAQKIRGAIAGYRLQVGDRAFTVGTSIGVVEVTPDMSTAKSVLQAADSACYAAKRSGRNRVVTYGAVHAEDPAAAAVL